MQQQAIKLALVYADEDEPSVAVENEVRDAEEEVVPQNEFKQVVDDEELQVPLLSASIMLTNKLRRRTCSCLILTCQTEVATLCQNTWK